MARANTTLHCRQRDVKADSQLIGKQGCTVSSEDIPPAELTLGLDVDFTALGKLQGKTLEHFG